MGDLREDYDDLKEHRQQTKAARRQDNLKYLQDNSISWSWIDMLSDHVLINGVIDYYLGKTYWFNRQTKESGYTMLNKLRL